jgi:hypothetical protein
MELDSKQKVLLAIFAEYQKDLPNMDSITSVSLGLEQDVFKVAVEKLINEGMVRDVTIQHGGNDTVPLYVNLRYCKMTSYGIQYVEKKLELDQTLSGEQKVKKMVEKTTKWGWDQFKDFGARVIAEMLKQ